MAGLVAAVLCVALFSCSGSPQEKQQPRAERGVLDLSGWDFQADGPANLNGQWEFLWDRNFDPARPGGLFGSRRADYFPLPSLWKGHTEQGVAVASSGRAVYALTVRLAGSPGPLRLHISGVLSVCRVWVDGRLLTANGEFGGGSANGVEQRTENPRTHILMPQFTPSGGTVRIVLEVSNHTNVQGGLNSVIKLGQAEQISRMASVHWILGALISGVLLAMSAYHLVLFAARRQDRANLYFGLFCLAWSLATLFSPGSDFLMSRLATALPWRSHIDLALLPYGLTNPLMVIFYHSLFPKRWGRAVNILFCSLGAAFMLYVVLSPPSAYGTVPLLYFVVTRTAFLYLFGSFALDLWRREPGVAVLVPGYLALLWAEASRILFIQHATNSASFAPYGMLLFIAAYAVFMSRRFALTSARVERLSGELEASNERLLRLNLLKDEFLANSTHELKTPLAGMVGISESLLAGSGGELPEEAKNGLRILAHSGKRLSRLVDDVLDHARLENKDVRLTPEAVDLRGVVLRVLALARNLAEEKGLALQCRVAEGLPPVLADPGRLEQILINLVGNAIKYTRQGRVEVFAEVLGSTLRAGVADTGVGVPEADRQRIFEPYEQLAEGDRGVSGGAGLGLAITKRLVELHGGELALSPAPGGGSVFSFSLPLAQRGALPDSTPCAAEPSGAERVLPVALDEPDTARAGDDSEAPDPDRRVLVVDDEPVNRYAVAACLKLAGMGVKTARDGAEALSLLAGGERPGVVVLDVMMPGLDGYAVCRALRRTHSALELPVVMLTCRNRVEDVVEGFAAGANDYVTKPFSREELLARVGTQLQLAKAHHVLEDNARLRREVELRGRTVRELRQRQLRLSRMLDAIGEAVVAVNASREVAFCNRSFETLLGLDAAATLGRPAATLLGNQDAPASQALLAALDLLAAGGQAGEIPPVELLGAEGRIVACIVSATPLELEEEQLALLSLRPAGGMTGEEGGEAPAAMLCRLEGNRRRIRRLEEALLALEDDGEAKRMALDDLRTIDTLLESMSNRLNGGPGAGDPRELAVGAMRAALDCWTAATGLDKGELAVRSGLWNAYMERDGYLRTQTLDKYLSLDTLPKRPRWRSVVDTLEFVLASGPDDLPCSLELQEYLAQLKPRA